MSRNLVVAIVLVALVSAGCGGSGDGPADSGSDADTSIIAGSGGTTGEDDLGVRGSPDADDNAAIVSGSDPDVTDDAGGDSQADEEAVGDRWGWCANWAGVQAEAASVLAAEIALAEAWEALSAAGSEFDQARAEAAFETAGEVLSGAEAALGSAQSAWEAALERAKDEAVADNNEDAFLAADVAIAVLDGQAESFDQFGRSWVGVLDAPRTVVSPQIATATRQFLFAHQAWFGAIRRQDPPTSLMRIREAAEAVAEVGYVDAPLWGAMAVAAEAAFETEMFFNEVQEMSGDMSAGFEPEITDSSPSGTFWADEAATAAEWAAAAGDALWVHYSTLDPRTRQEAGAWAASIASEAPNFRFANSDGDLPSPASPPDTVSDALMAFESVSKALAELARSAGGPAPDVLGEPRADASLDAAWWITSRSASRADSSFRRALESISVGLSNAIIADLCSG